MTTLLLQSVGTLFREKVLAARLNRNVEIKHGVGAVIFAQPAANDYANVGGRIAMDGTDPLLHEDEL